MAILPVLWILLEAALHVQPTNLLELGAIAGAIFTAGGLVVALVSLYSMANVQKIARGEVDRLLVVLRNQINDRVQTYLRAYDRYLQAIDVVRHLNLGGATDAEIHIKAALDIDSGLVGARTWMGGIYYQLAGIQFIELNRDGGIQTPTYLRSDALQPTVTRAINWLVDAKVNRDSDVLETTTRLAELYGMMGGFYQEMLSCTREVVNAGKRDSFQGNCSKAFLAAGCGEDAAKLSELAALLDCELPWSLQKLQNEWSAYCQEYVRRGATYPAMSLWVIPRSQFAKADDPRSPAGVMVLPAEYGAKAVARWITRVQIPNMPVRRGGIPEINYQADGNAAETEPLPSDEILQALHARFFIIGRAEWLQFPERT